MSFTRNPFGKSPVDPSIATRLGTTELAAQQVENFNQLLNAVQPVFFEIKTGFDEILWGHSGSFKDVKLPKTASIWRLAILHVRFNNEYLGTESYLALRRPGVHWYWRTYTAPADQITDHTYLGRHSLAASGTELWFPEPGPGVLFPSIDGQEYDVRFKLEGNMLSKAYRLYALFVSERISVRDDLQNQHPLSA